MSFVSRATRRVGYGLLQVQRSLRILVQRFLADRCQLHAAALAYTTVLSLVPLLALMFAVLKGLGVQRRLEPLLLSRLALSQDVTDRVIEYIDRTNVGTLGALGACFLVVTVISLLASVEASFNHIWRVDRGRTWIRKATDYLSTVLLTPILLLAAVAVTSSAQEQALLRLLLRTEYIGDALLQSLRLAPIIMNIAALVILYAIMPNRRPRLPSILVGGFVAGCAWQVVQSSYVALGVGVARYNAIYGALSQLPITLVWIYVSWVVVLAGAEIAALHEFGLDDQRAAGPRSRLAIALHLLVRAGEAFRGEAGRVNVRSVARELRADTDSVAEVADLLQQRGLLASLDEPVPVYVLARDPAVIDLAQLDALFDASPPPFGCDARVRAVLERMNRERHGNLAAVRLADILDHRDLQSQ